MNPPVESVLNVARAEIGTREQPQQSNSVKYNRAFYGNDTRAPWSVVFQWWCFQKAGLSTSVFPKSASVFAVRDWYKERGRFDSTPRVGSLVIFTFSHIGIVEKVLSGGRVQTIEGNTDAMGARTGGQVMRKIRSRGIEGYCHPDYGSTEPSASEPETGETSGLPAGPPVDDSDLPDLYPQDVADGGIDDQAGTLQKLPDEDDQVLPDDDPPAAGTGG